MAIGLHFNHFMMVEKSKFLKSHTSLITTDNVLPDVIIIYLLMITLNANEINVLILKMEVNCL